MIIREVQSGDGEALVALFQDLDSETDFMMLEPGERKTDVREQEQQIQDILNSTSKAMFVAVDNTSHEMMGFIVGIGGQFIRSKHSLYCVIGVRQAYGRQGVGMSLVKKLEAWAKSGQFHRVELTVMEHNTKAINLYKKCGFQQEGVKRDSLKVNGVFINEFYMAKIL